MIKNKEFRKQISNEEYYDIIKKYTTDAFKASYRKRTYYNPAYKDFLVEEIPYEYIYI